MMQRYDVRGDLNIDEIGHDRETGVVEIHFYTSPIGTFVYKNVPQDVFEGLYNAGSKTTDYYRANFKKRYGEHMADASDEELDQAA